MLKIITVFLFVFTYNLAGAELDNPSQEALDKTVKTMTNPADREKAFKENPQMREGESGADMLVKGNDAQKQQIYELAAKVLQGLAEKANGDPVKMQEIVSQGSKNPGQFMQDHLSEEQKKQVRDLAAEIEKSREPKSPAPSK